MKLPATIPTPIVRMLTGLFDLRVVLGILIVLYAVGYAFHPAVPGGNPAYPLGWWGWIDQGHYLTSAKALSQLDFSPHKHFYLPLYAAAGALFVPWSNFHPFWLIDLACLLWFAAVFIIVAGAFVGRTVAVLLLFGSVVANYEIFECFLIPWTSTITAALVSTAIYALFQLRERAGAIPADTHPLSPTRVFLFSLITGLLVLARPLDAVVGGVLWLGLVLITLRAGRKRDVPGMRRWWSLPALAVLGFCVGPAIFLAFNQAVFGTPAGAYFHAAAANGYHPADLAEKFVSIFLDSQTLYLAPAAGIVDHYPWLVLSFVAILRLVWRADWLLRLIALAVCVQFVLYLPYGDLLPTGLWRYLNIHYFKWTFPYLALFAWLLLVGLAQAWCGNIKRALAETLIVALVAGTFFSLRLRLDTLGESIQVEVTPGAGAGRAGMIAANGQAIDLVDITGWHGGFEEVYFGNHRVRIDGKALQGVRDFKVLPAPWGVRILFLRPARGAAIEFELDPRMVRKTPEQARASLRTYSFVLRPHAAFVEGAASASYAYKVGETIDFSSRGNSDWYARDGWSYSEAWGRWTDGGTSRLRMRLSRPDARHLLIRMRAHAFVTDKHQRQMIELWANDRLVGRLDFRLENVGANDHDLVIPLPSNVIGSDGELQLAFRLPDAAAPRSFGLSSDWRTLGLGLVEMSIVASEAGVSK